MKSLKGKRLGSVWARTRIEYREGVRWDGIIGLVYTGSSVTHVSPRPVLYFWYTLVSIGLP